METLSNTKLSLQSNLLWCLLFITLFLAGCIKYDQTEDKRYAPPSTFVKVIRDENYSILAQSGIQADDSKYYIFSQFEASGSLNDGILIQEPYFETKHELKIQTNSSKNLKTWNNKFYYSSYLYTGTFPSLFTIESLGVVSLNGQTESSKTIRLTDNWQLPTRILDFDIMKEKILACCIEGSQMGYLFVNKGLDTISKPIIFDKSYKTNSSDTKVAINGDGDLLIWRIKDDIKTIPKLLFKSEILSGNIILQNKINSNYELNNTIPYEIVKIDDNLRMFIGFTVKSLNAMGDIDLDKFTYHLFNDKGIPQWTESKSLPLASASLYNIYDNKERRIVGVGGDSTSLYLNFIDLMGNYTQKTLYKTSPNQEIGVISLFKCPDSGLLIAGQIHIIGSKNHSILLIKTDKDGNIKQ